MLSSRGKGMGKNKSKFNPSAGGQNVKLLFCFLILVFLFQLLLGLDFVRAYSLDDSSGSAGSTESFFNKNPFQFSPIDINQFIKKDRFDLNFDDLLNTRSFSSQDIGASLKAVFILFIKLIVTTLNVTLGILKVLLEVLTRVI
ncbi:MAG: hypothetical protein A3I92_01045 [Candidatus Yanofskybacteria bacterium RIFCSPLOWO2_02_FULL_43_10b]|uniref:Uncharacterized protein n=2 Tax=Candidatus Yanofskyibacteriota TaxID=1752733 RepID=A0A1F8H259_9BACT|nr:MAG: hypothetical protein A3I92_01045 [Candidatus Yanofskybacteria bacterium RIFCSPLOWO2_02_FULL_43_10b]